MVMGLVGEDKMKESLSDYLTKFKYSNAEGKDLWDAINKVSEMSKRSFFRLIITLFV